MMTFFQCSTCRELSFRSQIFQRDLRSCRRLSLGRATRPIAGVAGDQHASLFGQCCFESGSAKNTYGTGCFVLANTGRNRVDSTAGLITTVGWAIGDETVYALEGSVFSAGATVQWLRDELGIIGTSAESESLASQVADNGGVYLVPAFSGLGAPYWDMYARAAIVGLTRGSTAAHVARAALESIAYQTRDILDAMRQDTGASLSSLRVDGGATDNRLLMQFQSDLLGVPVLRSAVRETTALGAGYLAGLGVGFWDRPNDIEGLWQADETFHPAMSDDRRENLYGDWRRAVDRSRNWAS
ncbi:Glycerol kinase [Geodia barretti]|nr:Glycerol kinase [Geodia barretti]